MPTPRALLLAVLATARAAVLDLDHTNFDSTVTTEQLWIVKFYGECPCCSSRSGKKKKPCVHRSISSLIRLQPHLLW